MIADDNMSCKFQTMSLIYIVYICVRCHSMQGAPSAFKQKSLLHSSIICRNLDFLNLQAFIPCWYLQTTYLGWGIQLSLDRFGHLNKPLQTLTAHCHFAETSEHKAGLDLWLTDNLAKLLHTEFSNWIPSNGSRCPGCTKWGKDTVNKGQNMPWHQLFLLSCPVSLCPTRILWELPFYFNTGSNSIISLRCTSAFNTCSLTDSNTCSWPLTYSVPLPMPKASLTPPLQQPLWIPPCWDTICGAHMPWFTVATEDLAQNPPHKSP